MARRRREKIHFRGITKRISIAICPPQAENFWAFWRRFCTKNTFLSAFWTRFSHKNAPEILKIFRLRRAYISISPPIGGEISEISPPDPSDQGGKYTPISPPDPSDQGGNIIDFGVSPPIGGEKITPVLTQMVISPRRVGLVLTPV